MQRCWGICIEWIELLQIFPMVSDQLLCLRIEEKNIFVVVSLGFEFGCSLASGPPCSAFGCLGHTREGAALLKPGNFVERKEQDMAFTPAKSRDSWFALFSLTVAKRRRVCSVAHTFMRNRMWRESVGRRGERKCGQCRADEGDVGGHLIYYCIVGIRCTTTV